MLTIADGTRRRIADAVVEHAEGAGKSASNVGNEASVAVIRLAGEASAEPLADPAESVVRGLLGAIDT